MVATQIGILQLPVIKELVVIYRWMNKHDFWMRDEWRERLLRQERELRALGHLRLRRSILDTSLSWRWGILLQCPWIAVVKMSPVLEKVEVSIQWRFCVAPLCFTTVYVLGFGRWQKLSLLSDIIILIKYC